jgi:hypothetical protein
MLEVLMKLGDERSVAAEKIARHVNKWPGMGAQALTGKTVIGWREQQRRSTGVQRKRFETRPPLRRNLAAACISARCENSTRCRRSRTRWTSLPAPSAAGSQAVN